MVNKVGAGEMVVNGIEVRYMVPESLKLKKQLKYIDTFGLLPFIHRLCFDPVRQTFDPQNILLTGPKGTGKSLLLAYIAQESDLPYLSVDCSEDTKERKLLGGFVARSGTTPFVLGTVANAIQVANEYGAAMLVFEELGALPNTHQKMLNALTDFRKKVEVPELAHRFELDPTAKLFVCATMNPTVYGSGYEINDDLKSRFVEMEVPYPPPAAEKRILRETAPAGVNIQDDVLDYLVKIAKESRQDVTGYALSPRDLVQLLQVWTRLGWEDTLFLGAQKFSPEDRKVIIDRIKDITRLGVHADLKERANALRLTQQ